MGVFELSGHHGQTIYLVRHGETESAFPRPLIGQKDVDLGCKGLEQARKLAEQFKDLNIAAIYCSDLKRSYATAKIVAEALGQELAVCSELREVNLGDWDGLTKDEIRAQFPHQWEQRGEDFECYRPKGGESFADLRDRVIPFFCEVLADAKKPAIIIGHAGVNRVILCCVLGMPLSHLFRLSQDFGAVNIIEFREENFRVSAMNCRRPISPTV